MRFAPKIDVPSSLRDLDSLRVDLREDYFEVSAVEFRGKRFVHWLLKVNYFYHALPGLSGWRRGAQGTVELEVAKAVRIVWRNIHHEATKVWPNQYLWTEILQQYREDFEGDFERGVFGKAEQRMQEEEDKANLRREQQAEDRLRAKQAVQALRLLHSQLLARSRVGSGEQVAFGAEKPLRPDLLDWGDFYAVSLD